jgi:hypothetical protein
LRRCEWKTNRLHDHVLLVLLLHGMDLTSLLLLEVHGGEYGFELAEVMVVG